MDKLSTDDPIVALASPWGESAIAVIRTTGEAALELISRIFRGRVDINQTRGHTIHFGKLCDSDNNEAIDEIMLAVYRAPKSYTGENSAELFCHGSLAVINAIIAVLLKAGFRQAAPGEFTQRAFTNGRIDLTRAEAVNEIIRAKSDKARALALNRLSGAIEARINSIKERILGLMAALEILIDYPDEDIAEETAAWLQTTAAIRTGVDTLLATYNTGKIIQEGIVVVIAGKTNAGKSTLFNLLLKEDRAIVSEIHGTTRDYLEGAIVIHGIPVRLFDTAGLRKTANPLEIEGMRRTDKLLESADCILFTADAEVGLLDEDRAFLEKYRQHTCLVKVWNKIDLNRQGCPADFLPMSAQTGEGLALLNSRIASGVVNESSLAGSEPVIDSLRQKKLLEECAVCLAEFAQGLAAGLSLDIVAVDLREALDCLGEITGEITSEDILKEMFSRFCVGK